MFVPWELTMQDRCSIRLTEPQVAAAQKSWELGRFPGCKSLNRNLKTETLRTHGNM